MERVLGRYELVRPLGRGGMAEVFLARRRGPAGVEKRLVIKRIRPEKSEDPRFLELFVAEARLSMQLAHANIVSVFDFGRVDHEFFLVMDFVDGIDLGVAFARNAPALSPILIAHIGAEACKALDYAHRQRGRDGELLGVVHRDVKPNNLIISRSGEVKLVDFGVAALTGNNSGSVRGTAGYMAPEQANGESVDARSDLFSLGLVMWRALMGKPASGHLDHSGLIAWSKKGDVPALADDVPLGLRDVIMKATRPDPRDRYADARPMLEALDAYVVDVRAAKKRESPSRELARWATELCQQNREPSDEMEVPEGFGGGHVLTFLEHGSSALGADEATSRSIAETMAGSEVGASEPARARGLPWLTVAFVAALGVVGVALLNGESTQGTEPVAMAEMSAAADAAPVVVVDAALQSVQVTYDAVGIKRTIVVPRKAARVVGEGTLHISPSPWAVVTVVGSKKHCTETPCTLTLSAGTHRLRLRNPIEKLGKDVTVVVKAGEEQDIIETLAPLTTK